MITGDTPLLLPKEFTIAAERYLTWCKMRALPYWAEKSRDPDGGFFERLHFDGSPDLAVMRRVRVQARQVYVYAHAHYLGWHDDGGATAAHGFSYLTKQGMQGVEELADYGTKGCAHLLNPDGTLADGMRDTYAQAFLILACAWYAKAFNDPQAVKLLSGTVAFLDQQLAAGNGGYLESLPPRLPRRQNPHMHLFEAFLTAYTLTGEPGYLEKVKDIYRLFTNHFYDPSSRVLREFFNTDWSLDNEKGSIIEPGHMMEWCWLLGLYAEAAGENVVEKQDQLHQRALALGLDPQSGFLADDICLKTQATSRTRRSWPQTEYIKSCITLAHVKQKEQYLTAAATVLQRLMETYLAVPEPGGWRDSYDSDGMPVDDYMQTSTFYHYFALAVEVDKTLRIGKHTLSL